MIKIIIESFHEHAHTYKFLKASQKLRFALFHNIFYEVSSIVQWGYQDNFKSVFFFFYEKISRAQKHVTSKKFIENLIDEECQKEKIFAEKVIFLQA